MLIIKRVDNYLNIIIANILNIEHGVKKYNDDLTLITESSDESQPMLTITAPNPLPYSNPIKFKINSRVGHIICLLEHVSPDHSTIKYFIKLLKSKLKHISSDHLNRNITSVSIGTMTSQNLGIKNVPRKFILTNDNMIPEAKIAGFTWYVSGLTDMIYTPHIYSKLTQIIPFISSILYDEIDVFNYNHGDTVTKVMVSNMKIPQLPEQLKIISELMQNDQIGILINHDTYDIEFISQYSAILCTTLKSNNLKITNNHKILKWDQVKNNLSFNSSCEYNCFVCRFPINTAGFAIVSFTIKGDAIDDELMEIYYTYIDPIMNHFQERIDDKNILMCSHCIRIIKYLFRVDIHLDYFMVHIPIRYKQLVAMSPTTGIYAKLLESADIGRESRIVKVTDSITSKQFYFIDRKEMKNILVKDSNVRHSKLPLMPVTMFWYNSEVGYR